MKNMKPRLAVSIGKLRLKNPVMTASGTFGYAEEFRDFLDLRRLGAIVTKTVTLRPRQGNPAPRTCETPAGMLNSIGLANPGLDVFLKEKLPRLKKTGVPVIMSIASEKDPSEFAEIARRVAGLDEIAALELNISCPNIGRREGVSAGLISQDARATYKVVGSVRRITGKTLITKLTPNVTDIAAIAASCEDAGSDAVALINTLSGMCVDVRARRPRIAAITGGLSGPAIRPVAVRMVWEVRRKIKIPVIGMGGIMDADNALEFLIAGATAVSAGMVNFINPSAAVRIIDGLRAYLVGCGIADINDIIGSLHT